MTTIGGKNRLVLTLLSFLLAVVALSQPAKADSTSIPIQGFVIDSESGDPLEEILSVTFNLYGTCDDEETAYSETQSVEFANGLYGTSLEVPDEVIKDADALCLGVQIEGDSEMSPRMEYFSVPYARFAQQAETANIADVALTLDSSVLTELVGSGLNVSGDTISLDTSASQTWTATQTYSSQVVVSSDPADTSSANASFKINPSSSSTNEKFFVVQNNGTDRFSVDAEGDVTIAGNLTVTGSLGGSGLGDITGVTAGPGLTGGGTSGDVTLTLNAAVAPTWTGSHTFESSTTFSNDVNFSLVDDEQLVINTLLDGTDVNDSVSLSLTNATTSGTQRGIVIANNASTGTTDSMVTLSNADTDTAVTSGITISNSGGGFTNFVDTPSIDITGTGAISGATGITSSGPITLSGLTSCTALETNSSGIVACGTASTGDITGVTAGTGLSGGGTSGDVTLSSVLGTSIESSEITDDTISASDLAADSVNSSEIAADAVGSTEISADAVGSSEIAADAVGTSEIATDGVGSSEIAADAVGSSELASTSVTAGTYTIATVTVDADGRVTSASSGSASGDISSVGSCSTGDCFIDGTDHSLIFEGSTTDSFETTLSAGDPTADRSITLPDSAGEISVLGQSIESSEITNDTITSSDISADAVGSSEIASTSVTAGSYTVASITVDADGRITSASSGSETGDISSVTAGTGLTGGGTSGDVTLSSVLGTSIESSEITDDTIANADLAADSVNSSEIATDGVGSSEIAADAVGSSELASTSVTAGSYSLATVTIDADGRITSSAHGTSTNSNLTINGNATATGDLDAAGGFKMMLGPFEETNLASGTTKSWSVSSEGLASSTIRAPWSGSVMGVSVTCSANGAGGTLTMKGTINGTATTVSASMSAGSSSASGTTTKDAETFSAGALIGCQGATAAGWSSTTVDCTCAVFVEM